LSKVQNSGRGWDRRATKEWYVPSNTADGHILPDSQTLRDRSRGLIRNTPLVTGAVNAVVQNVVGGGLQLQARPEREVLSSCAAPTGSLIFRFLAQALPPGLASAALRPGPVSPALSIRKSGSAKVSGSGDSFT
jgi:hypothetical protein